MNDSLAEQVWTLLVGSILSAWFIASVLHQFRFKWWYRVSRFDALHLLPCWTFFAPNPGRHDFHVVYRDWAGDGHGPWLEFAAPQVETRWRWIWNPSRYPNKAISDLTSGLLQAVQSSGDEPSVVMLSSSYIGMLHAVMAQPPGGENADRRQFAVLKTHGFGCDRRLEIAYISGLHRAEVLHAGA